MASRDLVHLEQDASHAEARLTSREMQKAEQAMLQSAMRLAARSFSQPVADSDVAQACIGLPEEPRVAAQHVLLKTAGLAIVEGYAGAGKSRMLRHAKDAWEAAGYRVLGGALSG